jgi:hypothetical protein
MVLKRFSRKAAPREKPLLDVPAEPIGASGGVLRRAKHGRAINRRVGSLHRRAVIAIGA